MPVTDIDVAREDERQARAALLQAWRVWAKVQGEHLTAKLLDEGKLTAVKQQAVTNEIAESIPALKEALAELATRHGEKLAGWGQGLQDLPKDRAGEIWASAIDAARLDFGRLFHPLGYVMNSLNHSRDWAGVEDWEFYEPKTGTARSRYLQPDGDSSLDLEDAEREYAAATSRVKAAANALGTDAAGALWDAS